MSQEKLTTKPAEFESSTGKWQMNRIHPLQYRLGAQVLKTNDITGSLEKHIPIMVRQALGNCSMRCPTSCMPDEAGQTLRAVDHERNSLICNVPFAFMHCGY